MRGPASLVLALGLVSPAAAQAPASGSLLVLPASAEPSPPDAVRTAAEVVEAELEARGLPVIDPRQAVRRFHQTHSSDPVPTETGELEELADAAERALIQVASGQRQRAQSTVREILDRAQRSLESLNRETASATRLFDACLYMVRALLEAGDSDGAYAQAVACRRISIDLAANPRRHPPRVVELLRRADTALGARGATLRVESTPSPCPLYVNGRRLGSTPRELSSLPAGTYRIQADCDPDRPGRVHHVELGDRPVTLHIDHRFDSAVRTNSGRLTLRYPDAETLETHRVADGVTVARHAGALQLWQITPERPDVVRVDAIDLHRGRRVASVLLRTNVAGTAFLHDPLSAAFEALSAGESLDLTDHRPRPLPVPAAAGQRAPPARASAPPGPARASAPPGSAEESRAPEAAGGVPAWIGWTAAGAAVLSYAATVYLWTERFRLAERYRIAEPSDVDYLTRQGDWLESRPRHVVASLVTMPLSATAVALLLPEADGVPWWAWASGAAGAGAAVWAAGKFAVDRSVECTDPDDESTCTNRNEGFGWVPMPLATTALAVPATYLLRGWFGDGVAGASASGSHALLFAGGTMP